jgi:uncharacterized protein (TIGR00251 family)
VRGPTVRLQLRVSPGAGRSAIVGRHGQAWKIRVAPAPERGKANAALLDLLSETLRLPRERLELVGGRTGRDKIVALDGLTEEEVESRLEKASGGVR